MKDGLVIRNIAKIQISLIELRTHYLLNPEFYGSELITKYLTKVEKMQNTMLELENDQV